MMIPIKSLYEQICNTPYGSNRRQLILQFMRTNEWKPGWMCVNCSHRMQTKNDPDLQYLLNRGIIRMVRDGTPNHSKIVKRSGSRRTYVVINE